MSSTPEDRRARFEAARDLFDEVCELPAAEQERLLAERCAGDAELRAEVELLLDADRESASGLEAPALDDFHLDRAVGDTRAALESVGSVLGSYRLVEELGTGGFGTVFLAEQEGPLRRQVALKVVKPGMDTREVLARFDTERRALALMNHRNIARVYDAGATPSGRPYFVMELVRGERITHYADRANLSVRERLELFGQVCAAIQHAHQKGILHRDVKPSNVLVTEEEGEPVVKVIDFGIARAVEQSVDDATLVTAVHGAVGTPEYMSPEQTGLEGQDVDTRSDVYSLSVLLYELLVGATPFERRRSERSSYTALQRAIREEEAVRPSKRAQQEGGASRQLLRQLRGDLDWVVMRGLEKDRARRYETVAALADDLERFLNHEPVSATPPSGAYRLAKFARRNRVGIAVGAALLAGLVVAGSGWRRALDERDQKSAALDAKDEALGEKVAALAEKDVALEEALAATDFLADAIAAANPEEQDKDMTVRALLDVTAPRIGETFVDAPSVAARLHEAVGEAYYSLTLYEEGLEHFAQALEKRRASGGERSPLATRLVRRLGDSHMRMGRLDRAEALLQEGLALAEEVHGARSLEVASMLSNLGSLEKELGRMQASKERYEAALEIVDATPNVPPYRRLNLLNGLSIAYARTGDLERAEQLFDEILAGNIEQHGEDAPEVVSALYNLGTLYGLQGRFAEALEIDREVLAVRLRTLGDEHLETALAKSAVAQGLMRERSFDESERLFLEALAVFEERFPEGHSRTCDLLTNLAFLDRERGRPEAAVARSREVIEMRERIDGPFHWKTIQSIEHLGRNLAAAGLLEEARAELERSFELGTGHVGPSEPVTLWALDALCVVTVDLGRVRDAIPLYREMLARTEASQLGEHYTLENARLGLARCLIREEAGDLADPEEALVLARLACETRQPRAVLFAGLSAVEEANGNLDRAVEALEVGIELGSPEEAALREALEELLARRAAANAGSQE